MGAGLYWVTAASLTNNNGDPQFCRYLNLVVCFPSIMLIFCYMIIYFHLFHIFMSSRIQITGKNASLKKCLYISKVLHWVKMGLFVTAEITLVVLFGLIQSWDMNIFII